MKLRKRLTYANVMSSIAVFLVLGGATAFAATKIGANGIKSNAIKTGKIAKEAVTTAKIKKGAVTGAKVKESSLGTVPNSSTTDEIQSSKGTVTKGQQATAFEYGPFKIVVKCTPHNVTELRARAYIESSTAGSVFTSWEDGSSNLGPATPEDERELQSPNWGSSNGTYYYDSAADGGVSATAASGQSFTAWVGLASDEATNTCWYWSTATIIG